MTRKSIAVGDCIVDVLDRSIRSPAGVTHVEPKAFDVLLHLIGSAPDWVRTEALLDTHWRGVAVGDNVIHQAISRIRAGFGDDARNPEYIETRSKTGYRIIAEVRDQAPEGERPRIAVLPLRDFSERPDAAFAAERACAELARQLALQDFVVVSRDVTENAHPEDTSEADLGLQLGVTHVVRGALLLADSHLQLCVWMNEVKGGVLVWSTSYDQAFGNGCDPYANVAKLAVRELAHRLTVHGHAHADEPRAQAPKVPSDRVRLVSP